jgi:hypothetical protein
VEEELGTTAFAGGEGAPMGGDGGCGVLQHRCRRGEDEISFNLGTAKLGGALTGEGEDSGGARQNPT